MSARLVSVIMPAYESHGFITNSIKSVLAQTYPHWELIVISDDGKPYDLPPDSRIKFLSTGKTGSGPSKARNMAMEQATGEIIATLDSDDLFHAKKLETMVDKCLEYGLTTCSLRRITDGGSAVATAHCLQNTGELNVEDYLATNFSTNSHIMFRRDLRLKYPEYINYLEDLTLPVTFFDNNQLSYHFADELHTWVKRDDSASNKPGAPKQFVLAKQIILQKISEGTFGIKAAETLTAYKNFVSTSLECEKIFDDQVTLGVKDIDFTDIFIGEISKLYPKKEYAYKNKTYINGKIKPN